MVGVVVLSLIVVVRGPALPASAATTHRTDPSRTQLEHAGLEASHCRAVGVVIVSIPLAGSLLRGKHRRGADLRVLGKAWCGEGVRDLRS